VVTSPCTVGPGEYHYGNVNIIAGGSLTFDEKATASKIDFWASSIIIENRGALVAGDTRQPFGIYGGALTIHLYGTDQSNGDPTKNPGQGALCRSATNANTGPCGILQNIWADNGKNPITGCGAGKNDPAKTCLPGLPDSMSDYFYQYGPLFGDDKCTDGTKWTSSAGCGTPNGRAGYFGYKVLAVSYGGTLQLFGYKGACYSLGCDPRLTHASWTRLEASVKPVDGVTKQPPLIVDAPSNFHPEVTSFAENDEIVVTTTDYLPGHSEKFTVKCVSPPPDSGACIVQEVTPDGGWIQKFDVDPAVGFRHNGVRYGGAQSDNPLAKRLLDRIKNELDPDLVNNGAETRAAVALLTRSIRIVSAGDADSQGFPPSSPDAPCVANDRKGPCYSFGGHMVIRQGFQNVQIQGVEFAQMGQGGRLAHYPVHFHMARVTPPGTFVRDSSVNESMTRWMVVHSTQGVTLAGNVGYLSIGHGYYLEDGSETDNNFYGNIGIFARAAVDNKQNFRKVPGILAADGNFLDNTPIPPEAFPYRSDYDHPAVFWITNGWNDFIGNMAAGAGACGTAYWLVPAWNADRPDVPTTDNVEFGYHMKWSGFAALQKDQSYVGATPLKSFYGNYATSTMNSFQVVGNTSKCSGIVGWKDPDAKNPDHLVAIPSLAPVPQPPGKIDEDMYYPHVANAGSRTATKCPFVNGKYDCSLFTTGQVGVCNNGAAGEPKYNAEDYCAVTVLDHYTSSFHWAEKNLAAIWLRPQWYLVDNSVLTDVQNSGITFVTSGDYSRSAVIEGDWALARASIFVGTTQRDNPLASNAGPFTGTKGSLKCGGDPLAYCLSEDEGISMPLTNFGVNQRLFNIYDGPAYEDSNAYFDIAKTDCGTEAEMGTGACSMYASVAGVRKDNQGNQGHCYLPNAAIAWKQPNGFFYPPAFHSANLLFDTVDIRHYVIDALFQPNSYLTDGTKLSNDYCKPGNKPFETGFFTGYTDIDRQTELNDDDGSLTGLTNNANTGTISVNPVEYFNAPVQTPECLSNVGVQPTADCTIRQDTPLTATTSPYDYVTTVIYPGCAVGPGDALGRCGSDRDDQIVNGNRYLHQQGRGGTWSKECSNEACYGMILYRQFLTTDEDKLWNSGCNSDGTPAKCRWPFVRMGGQSTYQRSTLTTNHGTFFLDTTVSLDTQWKNENFTTVTPCDVATTGPCNPRSVNVFLPDQTYYMFFVFAKQATRQSYEIYVGSGFDINTVNAYRADLSIFPIQSFTKENNWPSPWEKHYNDKDACALTNQPAGCNNGILLMIVDFKNQADYQPIPTNGLCLPKNFCKPNGDSCGCALTNDDPLVTANPSILGECRKTCETWAVKDLDFPPKGPLGFSFTMPHVFPADDMGQKYRPQPKLFPTVAEGDKPDWTTTFSKTSTAPDNATGGQCYYAKVPGTDCSVP
jgi:cell migration-inducing and hyaluronan-binding protein